MTQSRADLSAQPCWAMVAESDSFVNPSWIIIPSMGNPRYHLLWAKWVLKWDETGVFCTWPLLGTYLAMFLLSCMDFVWTQIEIHQVFRRQKMARSRFSGVKMGFQFGIRCRTSPTRQGYLFTVRCRYWYLGDVGESIASAAHPAHPQVDLQQIGSVLELALPMAHIKMHWRGWRGWRGLRGLASVFNVFLEVGIRWRSLEWYQFGNMWKHKGADTKRSCLAAA